MGWKFGYSSAEQFLGYLRSVGCSWLRPSAGVTGAGGSALTWLAGWCWLLPEASAFPWDCLSQHGGWFSPEWMNQEAKMGAVKPLMISHTSHSVSLPYPTGHTGPALHQCGQQLHQGMSAVRLGHWGQFGGWLGIVVDRGKSWHSHTMFPCGPPSGCVVPVLHPSSHCTYRGADVFIAPYCCS